MKDLENELQMAKDALENLNSRVAVKRTLKNRFRSIKYYFLKRKLKNIVGNDSNKKIIIHIAVMDYNAVMQQRPQQIAKEFSKKDDVIYFYCFWRANVPFIEKVNDNLYLINNYKILFEYFKDAYIHIYANNTQFQLKELKTQIKQGKKIIYEYIDALHNDLEEIDSQLMEKHEYIIKNEEIPIFCTAQTLYDEIKSKRKKNVYLTSNGVNYDDFDLSVERNFELPDKLKEIYSKKREIICYYGAIAIWNDFILLDKLAKTYPEYDIILIGNKYGDVDKELEKILKNDNIYYLGPVSYNDLIKFGYYSSVLIIPFQINEITMATSPVKLFEYMAMEKPVVTTDLPECRKYKSIYIGKDNDDFIRKIKLAVAQKNNKSLKEQLRKDALKNTWEQKTNDIYKVIVKEEEKDEKN